MNLKHETLTHAGNASQPSDFAGNNGNIIWAIDGATPLWESVFTENDVAYALGILHEVLTSLDTAKFDENFTLQDFFAAGIYQAREQITEQYPNFFDVNEKYLITFSIAAARVKEDIVEYLILGDNALEYTIKIDSSIARSAITDTRIAPFKSVNRALIANTEKVEGKRPEALAEERLEIYRDARVVANQRGGYPIATFDLKTLEYSIRGSFYTSVREYPFTVAVFTNGFTSDFSPLPDDLTVRYIEGMKRLADSESGYEAAVAYVEVS